MKKWIVIILVVLVGTVLLLRKWEQISETGPGNGGMVSEAPQEPAPARQVQPPAQPAQAPAQLQAAATASAQVQLPPVTKPKVITGPHPLACKGTLEEIWKDYNVVWGFKKSMISRAKVNLIEDGLINYYACRAIGANKASQCYALPDETDENMKIGKADTPRARCLTDYLRISIMSGKGAFNQVECLKSLRLESLPMSGDEFCNLVKTNVSRVQSLGDAVCRSKYAPPESIRPCLAFFPSKPGDCGKNQECRRVFNVYGAISRGAGDRLGELEKPLFEAFNSRSAEPCQELLDSLTDFYCSVKTKIPQTGPGSVPEER